MGRPRRLVEPTNKTLAALIAWIHARLKESGVTYTQLARVLAYDRSWVSRSLDGRRLPAWPVVEAVATSCRASITEARQLWKVANAADRERVVRVADGYPPEGMETYADLCGALRDLIASRGISQRELVRRDDVGLLTRSTIGAVLRLERSLSYDVMAGAVRACGLSDAAIDAWLAEWERLGEPFREAMERRRREIAYARLRPRRWGYRW